MAEARRALLGHIRRGRYRTRRSCLRRERESATNCNNSRNGCVAFLLPLLQAMQSAAAVAVGEISSSFSRLHSVDGTRGYEGKEKEEEGVVEPSLSLLCCEWL